MFYQSSFFYGENKMLDYFFNDNETVLKKREKKKKLHELLDKYGSVEEIEKNAIGADGYEYMFANTDNLIDEVLQERHSQQSSLSPVRKDTPQKKNTLLPSDEDFSLDDLILSDKQRKAIKNLDMANQLTVIKALREQQNVEKPHQKVEEEIENMTAENKPNDDFRIHKAEKQYAENVYAGVKNDADAEVSTNTKTHRNVLSSLVKAKNDGIYKDNDKFNLLLKTVFKEEGGYEDNPKKIDQATNIGIIQSTLDNFNATHPKLKINKSLKEISEDDARLIYKLDYYDQYNIEAINDFENSKVLLHMFVMLKPHTALNILHTSLNDFGYPCKKLLTKQMIPMLNKINSDGKSSDFKKVLKSNYEEYLRNSPEASKYKGWFTRIKRL